MIYILSQIVYMNNIDLACYTVRLTIYQHVAKEQLT